MIFSRKSKNDQPKVVDQVKDWCGPISDDASDISSLKRTSDVDDCSNDEAKRIKLTDTNKDEAPKTPVTDNMEIPRSGIFKKSKLIVVIDYEYYFVGVDNCDHNFRSFLFAN